MRRCGTRRSNGKWLILLAIPFFLARPLAVGASVAELERSLAQAAPAGQSRILAELSAALEAEDMAKARDYAQRARQTAVTPADEARADARIAALQRRRGEYADALATAQDALDRPDKLPDDVRAELLLVVANTHDSLGDFPSALETFRRLMPLAEARGDPAFLARVNNTLGVTYYDAGETALAQRAFETARGFAEKSGDRRLLSSSLNNLGNLAIEAGDFTQARRHHELALALREAMGTEDTRGIADSHLNLAELAVMQGMPDVALPHLDRAIALHTALGLRRNLTNAHLTYASALAALKRDDEALRHLNTAQELAAALDTPVVSARVYRAFAGFYERKGDFRTALEYERKLAVATEAAVGEKSRQRFDTFQAQFQAERRQHEIDVLRRDRVLKDIELARVRWQRYGLAALALVSLVALGALVSRHRLKLRAERRIHAETRASRDAAERADALKTRLLGVVSHDIRGPVGNIMAMGEDLCDESPALATDQRVQLILHEAQRVLHLSQDLLDAAALEAGGLKLQTAPVDLAEIVRATFGRLQPAAVMKGQKLDFPVPAADTGIVTGDAMRLAQVVTNLVSNAIKYSPRDSVVQATVSRRNGTVLLAVRDEGPGIPAKSLPDLFQPFNRIGSRPTGGESSHGLGLSIAHDLVRLHGGSIRVDSVPGQGATFVVELPAAGSAPVA